MRVVPILVRTMYAGNVGAAARVAANFGVPRLVLVDPACSLEESDFFRMAMGAEQRIEIAVVSDLATALAGIDVAIATTSGRDRDPRGLLTPDEARRHLLGSGVGSLGVVFGPERRGLLREELHRCQLLLTIPSDPEFPVLNLAQAVAVVVSAITGSEVEPVRPADPLDGPAPDAEFNVVMAHLERVLLAVGFLDPVNPARVMDQLRRLFGRAVPTNRELAVLRGLASHVDTLQKRLDRERARALTGDAGRR